ncbi:putative DNA ligase family protein [uncultured Stenotrophomonas sp.]|uniref:DNA ligase (ATP) n=1 Tax=uncultured Stenotrophomonas sp. TaxID=165438 RepID=A0A1Y5QAX0_9GAMM|nr:putative DNA ligase family protein [uncultured Stenotrophomonas sp.]
MSLHEYRRKRRFERTPEPAPDARRRHGAQPIFVVQLHHASHRHYDFRLQVGDVLRSWAVPKGPSLDPAVKRLAAEVEDHPLDYAGFEGEIPKGQYGGGHVAIFDRGTWGTDGDPEQQLAKGHLRFRLHGGRLKGGWHLVRSGGQSRRPQWLLFKARDEYAADKEADDLLDATGKPVPVHPPQSASATTKKPVRNRRQLLAKAAKLPGARRSRRAPAFHAPQLATPTDAVPRGKGWLHEAKWDGYRLVAQLERGAVRLWSRNALEWTARLPAIVRALQALDVDAVLDGELVAGAGRQQDFGLLQATLSGARAAPLAYVLFDILQLGDIDLCGCGQLARKTLLSALLEAAPEHLVYSSHVSGNGERALALAVERGLEGIVCKRAGAPYRSGRGDDWRKVKQRASDEFAVVGYTAPKGSRTGFGALLLATPEGAAGWRYAGRVGTGFGRELLDALAQRLAGMTRRTPCVRTGADVAGLGQVHWVRPELVVEVYHHGTGNQGLLRQAAFKTIRADKTVADLRAAADIHREPDMHAATTRAKSPAAATNAEAVTLTSPTRVVYPDAGIRKRDVFAYYRSMLPWLLPEIADRPLSVVRCPQGAQRPCFFQKHLLAGMVRVDALPLEEEDGTRADYLVVRDADALLELVQFNTLEFHPWGALADAPDKADRMVFDLDPAPDVAWSRVVAAARQVRDRLRELGLESFVRTSGGKGLHVVVPLRPACPWPQVREFARAFAEAMAAADPLSYVATASKALRKGRIFIDYLRNGRGATSVASFSLRARAVAPVAMPLRWEELGRVKRSDAYTLTSAPRRMARMKAHPWGDIAAIKQDLDRTAALLAGKRRG